MNILIIGNGFDLAHGLPTKYIDFLEFVKVIRSIDEQNIFNDAEKVDVMLCNNRKIIFEIKAMIAKRFVACTLGKIEKELLSLIKSNIWINFFLQNPMYQRENWIDFESEICRFIKVVDYEMKGENFYGRIKESSVKCFNDFILNNESQTDYLIYGKVIDQMTYQKLRDSLLNDLNRLTRALELYLCEFAENMILVKALPDIKEIKFQKVLSFNYTNTYRKIYDPNGLAEYDYIHGKVDTNHSLTTNNMVLGIDEYLSEDRKDKDLELIAFKKYYQRIYKGSGCKYKEWLDQGKDQYHKYQENRNHYINMERYARMNGNEAEALKWSREVEILDRYDDGNKIINTYILGHSLDVTDKDVIRNFIINDKVHTTIFYFSKDDLAAKVTNLVKIIGQDELIRRTSGNTKTIEFRLQQDIIL